jgi:chorismate mutase
MNDSLLQLRDQIDNADKKLIAALAERFTVVAQIKAYKKEHHVPALDQNRYESMITDRKKLGEAHGLSPALIAAIFTAIHDHSLKQQL